MPILTPGDVHFSQILTQIMTGWRVQNDEFIADKVFPNIPVDKQSDQYYRFGAKSFLQTNAQKRSPRSETPGVDWTFTKDTYTADVWGIHHDIEDQFRANADENFRLDSAATELVTQQQLLRRELEWMNAFFKTGVWSENLTGIPTGPATPGTSFIQFDQAGSSPITEFRTAAMRFKLRTGLRPNFVVFGSQVWDALLDHPEIVDRVKYTKGGFLDRSDVAQAIKIQNIYVSDAVQADGATELVAVPIPTTTFLAGKHLLLGYAAPSPSRQTPSAGYTFSWKGYLGANAWGGRIKKFRMEPIACDRVESEAAYGMKVVAAELGSFWSGAVS